MRANTVLEETQRCLDNIERFDGQVNAFISVLSETALEEARAMDMALQRGEEQGLLAGVPMWRESNAPTAAGFSRIICHETTRWLYNDYARPGR